MSKRESMLGSYFVLIDFRLKQFSHGYWLMSGCFLTYFLKIH